MSRTAKRVAELLDKYQDVFALSYDELGTVRGVKHDIPTTTGCIGGTAQTETDTTADD